MVSDKSRSDTGHGDMWLEHVYLQIISAYYRTRVNTQRSTRWITPKSRVHDEQLVHTTIHDLPSARPRFVVSENTCPCHSFAFIRVIVRTRAANVYRAMCISTESRKAMPKRSWRRYLAGHLNIILYCIFCSLPFFCRHYSSKIKIILCIAYFLMFYLDC